MSARKPLLETVLDHLDQEFDKLEMLWNSESLIKDEIYVIQNSIVPLLRVLHNADLGENVENTQNRLRNMSRPGTDWSAVSVKSLIVSNALEVLENK